MENNRLFSSIHIKIAYPNKDGKSILACDIAVVLVLLYLWRDSVKRSHSASPYKDKDSRRVGACVNLWCQLKDICLPPDTSSVILLL